MACIHDYMSCTNLIDIALGVSVCVWGGGVGVFV